MMSHHKTNKYQPQTPDFIRAAVFRLCAKTRCFRLEFLIYCAGNIVPLIFSNNTVIKQIPHFSTESFLQT